MSEAIGGAPSAKMVGEVRAGPESPVQTGFGTISATVDECELKERRTWGWTKSRVVRAILGQFAAFRLEDKFQRSELLSTHSDKQRKAYFLFDFWPSLSQGRNEKSSLDLFHFI